MTRISATSRLMEHFDPRVLTSLASLDLKARYLVEGFLLGIHESPFHGLSVEFSEYREYQPGDDLRHLDWRVYARSDELYVKQYTQETNVRCYLLCDTSGSMAYRGGDAWGSKMEAARVIAAALTWLLLRQNDAVGLLVEGDGNGASFVRPTQKPSQFGILLQELESLQPAGGPKLPQLLERAVRLLHRRSLVFLLSDLLEPADSIADWLRQLKFLGHECMVIQILDRDEETFPFADAAVFEDLETGNRRKISPRSVRETYLQRFEAFQQAHRDQLRGLEMLHAVVRTDEDPFAALAEVLMRRKQLL